MSLILKHKIIMKLMLYMNPQYYDTTSKVNLMVTIIILMLLFIRYYAVYWEPSFSAPTFTITIPFLPGSCWEINNCVCRGWMFTATPSLTK